MSETRQSKRARHKDDLCQCGHPHRRTFWSCAHQAIESVKSTECSERFCGCNDFCAKPKPAQAPDLTRVQVLMDARHDVAHIETGKVRPLKPIKASAEACVHGCVEVHGFHVIHLDEEGKLHAGTKPCPIHGEGHSKPAVCPHCTAYLDEDERCDNLACKFFGHWPNGTGKQGATKS